MIRLAAIRRIPPRHVVPAIYNHHGNFSTSQSRASSSLGSAITTGLIAGLVGSGTLLVAGYAAYYFSGAKKAVDTFRPAMAFLKQTNQDLAKKAPVQALHHLRQAAKAYVAYLPFAGLLVDRAFDVADDVVATHTEEASALISQAYMDILQVVQQDENKHKTSAALQVVSIARRLLGELTALGVKAGRPISEQLGLEEKAGAVKAAAGSVYQEAAAKAPVIFGRLREKVNSAIPPRPQKEQDSESTSEKSDK